MSKIINGDCIEEMRKMEENSIDAIVSDPPYGLGFMGKSWDKFTAKEYQEFSLAWGKEAFRVLKPGGYLLAFSGTRTYHRMVVGLEDAGFVIKDMIEWMYGNGFPKSLNISKAIDKVPNIKYVTEFKKWLNKQIEKNGKPSSEINEECGFTATSYGNYEAKDGWAVNIPSEEKWTKMKEVIGLSDDYDWIIKNNVNERGFMDKTTGGMHGGSGHSLKFDKEGKQLKDNPIDAMAKKWNGFGTSLKPAHEPVVVAQKPCIGTYAENVLMYGVGGINIDGCRVKYTLSKETDGRIGTDEEWHGKREASEHTVSMPAIEGMQMYKNKGRFPSNVVLSHHPQCKLVGKKEVGKGEIKHNSEINRKGMKFDGPFSPMNSGFDVNKAQGLGSYGVETIEDWECHPDCPIKILDDQSGKTETKPNYNYKWDKTECEGNTFKGRGTYVPRIDSGGASRFFYCGKAYKTERNAGLKEFETIQREELTKRKPDSAGQNHPRCSMQSKEGYKNTIATLKPINLMRYLVRLVAPPKGKVFDPFAGSGTTGIACIIEGFEYILIEKREEFAKVIIPARLKWWSNPENWKMLKDHPELPNMKKKIKTTTNKNLNKWLGD